MDLISAYFSEKHSILHRWMALTNMQKNYDEVKGFIKFSINVIATGDDQTVLEDEKTKSNKNGEDCRIQLPPLINTIGHQLKIQLIKAQNLIKMDTWGSIDSYLIFEFGHVKFQTPVVKDNKNPFWGINISVFLFF